MCTSPTRTVAGKQGNTQLSDFHSNCLQCVRRLMQTASGQHPSASNLNWGCCFRWLSETCAILLAGLISRSMLKIHFRLLLKSYPLRITKSSSILKRTSIADSGMVQCHGLYKRENEKKNSLEMVERQADVFSQRFSPNVDHSHFHWIWLHPFNFSLFISISS